MTEDQREVRELKKSLRELTTSVATYMSALDKVMATEKESYERGKKVAELTNKLLLANEIAMRFGLVYSFNKIHKIHGEFATLDDSGREMYNPAPQKRAK